MLMFSRSVFTQLESVEVCYTALDPKCQINL